MDYRDFALNLAATPYPGCVAVALSRAFAHMKAGRGDDGVAWFKAARSLATNCCDQTRLDETIRRSAAALAAEAKLYKNLLNRRNGSGAGRFLAFSDSLGLPRLEAPRTEAGCRDTFSFMLQERLKAGARPTPVSAWCQRYLTTEGVVDLLPRLAPAVKGAHVLLHVGLNDCANRIFQERERHATTLLPKETADRMVAFARLYRAAIIASDDNYAYVTLPRFRENLARIAGLCAAQEAARLILTTIIMPPLRAAASTPNMAQNFTRYNLAVYDAARQLDAALLDVDRLMWAHDPDATLLADGMHLSEFGHRVMADAIAAMAEAA